MISALTAPCSIAVIGASSRIAGLAGRTLDFLDRYQFPGARYAVRPDGAAVLGVPSVSSARELPDDVDLAVIVVPAAKSVPAYADCIARGVPAAVVVASGFDARTERALRQLAEQGRTRLIGPNCVGFVNAHANVYATVASSFATEPALAGPVGLVTQSGGLGNAVVAALAARGLGISSWYSSGSEFDVGALEIMRALVADPDTKVIAAFVEGLRDGQGLVPLGRLARQAGKPVLILKGGLSSAGQRSALLHTGKASSGPRLWRDIAAQAGISLVGSLDELVDSAAVALGLPPVPPLGPRTTIMSASGGLGVLLADRCQVRGVPLAMPPRRTAAVVGRRLGLAEQVGNPIDIAAASDEQVSAAIECLVGEPGVDAVLFAASRITSKDYQLLGEYLHKVRERVGERLDRLVLSFLGPTDVATAAEREYLTAVATIIDTPFRAVDALAAGHRSTALRRRGAAGKGLRPRAAGARRHWADLQRLADRYDLPLAPSILATSAAEAGHAATRLGLPVAMKVVASTLWHRTDLGLVRVGIDSRAAVRTTFVELNERAQAAGIDADGVLVQQMAPPGLEVIVGVRWDAELGPVLSIGIGGTTVEVLGEIHSVALPASAADVRRLVRTGPLGALLAGVRGGPPLDADGLVRVARVAARLYAGERSVAELEMNPVIVGVDGVHVVDFKVVPA